MDFSRKQVGLLSLLIISFGIGLYFLFSGNSSVRDSKQIQRNLLKEIAWADENGERIQRILASKTYNFRTLTEASTYPVFLYKNKSLFYWSTTAIQPVYEYFSSNERIRYIVLKNGAFLCMKRSLRLGENEYEIVQLVPLYTKYGFENEYIRNGPNPLIFGKSRVRLNNYGTEGYSFKDDSGNYLFSVEKFYPERRSFEYLFDGLTLIAYCLVFFLFFEGYHSLSTRGKFQIGEFRLIYWIGSYLLLKLVTVQIGFPAQFIDTHLFDPRYMSSALWATSLGDIFIDAVFLLGLSLYAFRIFSRLWFVNWLLKCSDKRLLVIILSGAVLIIHGSLLLVFYVVGIIYEKAGVSLDFLQSYGFSIEKVVGLFIFLSYSLIFFLINQLWVRLILHISKLLGRRVVIFSFVASTFFYVMATGVINYSFLLITVLSSFYFLLAWWFSLPLSLNKLRFDTYIYFFTCAIVCASVGAYSAFRHTKYRLINEKVAFARQVLEENDFLAESLLKEASVKISKDPFIIRQMVGPFINDELVEQKIRKVYLNNYFNRFTIKVTLYDPNGNPYFNLPGTPNSIKLKKILEGKNFVTEIPNLFFVKNLKGNVVKQYFFFIPIRRGNMPVGEILLEISPKRNLPPVNVYPALLISQPDAEIVAQKEFEYAIYQNSLLVYSSGSYNYLSDFNIKMFQQSLSKEIIYNQEGFDHVVIKEGNNKTIVVSSPSLPLMDLLTMFSFLFLVLLFLSTVFVILYTIMVQRDLFSANFTTKIQIYINLAFFLPLFVISVATVGYISVMYESELKGSYQKKSALLSQQLSDVLEKYESKRIRMEGLENAVLQISRHTDTDVDVYDKKGRLIISSQPAIYSAGILSSLMDPLAIYDILEKQSNAALLPQKVGDFSYFKVFHSVRSAETGEVIGIIGLPFFGSKEELNRRRTEIVNYMLNIFTLIFIFFLLISFLSARILIVPLKIVTQKIRKVTLTGTNEPIRWESKDEIGLLISEYNNMLIKLKSSTKALANAEKETAWREMARQVAHEIKNPLTPMKLSLQHFKKRLELSPNGMESQPLDNVLLQIDKLANIANSFSSFASFPEPINQPYDVILALRTCAELHNNDGQETVEMKLESESCMVLGDVGFIERIFTNLILNAIQAVPIGRIPNIIISQEIRDAKYVYISISDNGDGIPDEIKDKVFLPNFSTKYAGSGIGLALAKKGIEQAGGKIWFTSETGKGTTFFVELPVLSFV